MERIVEISRVLIVFCKIKFVPNGLHTTSNEFNFRYLIRFVSSSDGYLIEKIFPQYLRPFSTNLLFLQSGSGSGLESLVNGYWN